MNSRYTSSLEGKNILVTGAGGFIGSHLAECLVEHGASVRAFLHYNSMGRCGWLDSSPASEHMEICFGDVADAETVDAAMDGVDIVFHLAALIGIPYSYEAPDSYIRTNIQGTHTVLRVAREKRIQRLIHTSTSEVYGTAQYVPIDESHPLQAQSPYAASKVAADKLVEAYYHSFRVPVVTVRPFNTFGPRQSSRAVIPTLVAQCLSNSNVIRVGNTRPTRDLNYVANTVRGFVAAAATADVEGGVYNLGSGREISIADLAKRIIQMTGSSAELVSEDRRVRPSGSEVKRLLACSDRAKNALGWSPEISLEQGLEGTIEWMRKNLDRCRSEGYVV